MPLLVTAGAFFVFGTISGTILFSELVKDHTHPPFKLAVLRDRKGDLTKEWYVEFYTMDDCKGELVRKRIVISPHFRDKRSRTETGSWPLQMTSYQNSFHLTIFSEAKFATEGRHEKTDRADHQRRSEEGRYDH